jgi:thymidylate synthase ThyX
MTKPRRIYLLSPKELSPETIAVTFAKTSRSPKPFDEIAAELTDERSAQFHEKWVVGYGHSSVAEHAVLHLAIENISRLAVETVESSRLGSYTEKSTRYQEWDADAFYLPDELQGSDWEDEYKATCTRLFTIYRESIAKVESWISASMPKKDVESPKAFERRVRSAAVDICRFLLPAAALANVGVTMNARAVEYTICKMLSSPLSEVREVGTNLREVCRLETPTLIKYAACNNYLVSTREKLRTYAAAIQPGSDDDFRLIDYDDDGEAKVLAALLYRFGRDKSFQAYFDAVHGLSENEKDQLAMDLMKNKGTFDQPLREFEYAQMTFDVVMDQGAYFEFKRHRMMTQTPQPLTPALGFAIPRGIAESGCGEFYENVMRDAGMLCERLAEREPDAASYIIPNGFNRRVLFTMNLREAFHFCRLRAARNAHFSIRRVAYRLAETIQRIYPRLGKYLDLPNDETWQGIEARHFSSISIR